MFWVSARLLNYEKGKSNVNTWKSNEKREELWSIYTLFPDLKEGRECLFSIASYDNNPIWLFVRVGWSQSWGKEYKIMPSNSIKRKTCNYIAVIRDTKCIWWKAAIAVICHIHFHIL